jgi:hypothetical protein
MPSKEAANGVGKQQLYLSTADETVDAKNLT